MKASEIRLSELKTWEDCYDAQKALVEDSDNSLGGLKLWNSGYATELKTAAQRKHDAIGQKMERLNPEED